MSEQPNIPIGNWEAVEHWVEELTKPSSDEVEALRRGIREISDQCTQFEDQLTAAQQRAAELEQEATEQAALIESHVMRIQQLTQRVTELEIYLATSEQLRAESDARHDRDYAEAQKQVDRLRELLRDAQQVLGTALVTLQEYDVYRKFPVTAAKWAELREKINAELAKGE